MVATQAITPAVPTIHQYIPFRPGQQRDEPEIPDSIHRSTESRAFRTIALRAHYRQQAGGRTGLPSMHLELLRLERGALQHLPQLTHDERMEFVAGAARLRNVTPRQIEALLDQASDIMMLRELSGLVTTIDDLDEAQMKQLYHGAIRPEKRRGRGATWVSHAAAR